MPKFHINPKNGNVGQCKASVQCPFGGDENHYSTEVKAREAFERSMAGELFYSGYDVHPNAQKQFCLGAERYARSGVNANYDYLRNLDRNYFYELDAAVVNTYWDNPKNAMETLTKLEHAIGELRQRAGQYDRSVRKENKLAEKYDVAAELLDKNLGEIQYDMLYRENIDRAQARQELIFGKKVVSDEDLVNDLRASVRDFRNPEATEADRETVLSFWAENNIKNQFQAMQKAADLEKQIEPKVPCDESHQERIAARGFCSKCGGAQ